MPSIYSHFQLYKCLKLDMSSSKNSTYFFGAGAVCQTHPNIECLDDAIT
jgi:hypothetical protein